MCVERGQVVGSGGKPPPSPVPKSSEATLIQANIFVKRVPNGSTTGRDHIAILPNTFQPHTFVTSFGRATKSQLWPIRP